MIFYRINDKGVTPFFNCSLHNFEKFFESYVDSHSANQCESYTQRECLCEFGNKFRSNLQKQHFFLKAVNATEKCYLLKVNLKIKKATAKIKSSNIFRLDLLFCLKINGIFHFLKKSNANGGLKKI